MASDPGKQFEKLNDLVSILRDPRKGCPWDLAQDETTVKPYVIEEAYEVLEALDTGEREKIREELGDLLFQVLFLSRIFEEKGDFSITDILASTHQKMKSRHPHIFSTGDARTVKDVLQNWEKLKNKEKRDETSMFEGLPASLPALLTADQITRRAARVGFDWKEIKDILLKLEEEVQELKKVIDGEDTEACLEEVGDVLFTIVNVARRKGLNAEEALRAANRKFIERFRYIERKLGERGKTLFQASMEEMDHLWDEAKEAEAV
jgi:MazG family protein